MSTREFQLSVFGFSATERRVIGSVIRLAVTRGRPYTLVDTTASTRADIAIVDWKDTEAVAQWREELASADGLPAVIIASDPSTVSEQHVVIKRPVSVRRLLEALDDVAIREFRYVPEFTIQDEDNNEILSGYALAAASRAAESSARTGLRALVVDDSATVRKLMGVQLGLFGIDVEFAETGEEALVKVEQTDYDAVFLDLTLPHMDGYGVCKSFRRSRRTAEVPVIMLTGRGSKIDRLRGTMAGCSAYLTKPVSQEELHEVIESVVFTGGQNADQQGA